MNIKFNRAFEGGYRVEVDGKTSGYIDRSLNGQAWCWNGRRFGRIAEAKAAIKCEIAAA